MAAAAAALALSLVLALPVTFAAADGPAAIQYELAVPSSGADSEPPGGAASGDRAGYDRVTPAGVTLGSLDSGEMILIVALALLIGGLAIALALRRRRLRQPRLTLVLALAGLTLSAGLLAALPAGGASSKPPRLPALFYGVSPQKDLPQSEYRRMKANGADSVRFGIPWSAVETSPGSYDFGAIDPFVERTARAGLEAFPFLGATPIFYGGNCTPADCFTRLPVSAEQKSAWAAFLRATVRRYGPQGSFWTENPGVPERPIRIYQIWNEWNFVFFTNPRSPRLYAELVKVSYGAIKSVDPGAKVILGGLFAHPKPAQGQQATAALNQLYRVPGIKSKFDGVALHPYAKDARDLRPDIRAIRAVMKRRGDAATPLYLTEMGWGSGRGTAFEKGPRGQVRELTEAFTLLRQMQRATKLQRVFWFSWDDLSGTCNFCDSTGLVRENGTAKPSLPRYRAFAKNRR